MKWPKYVYCESKKKKVAFDSKWTGRTIISNGNEIWVVYKRDILSISFELEVY